MRFRTHVANVSLLHKIIRYLAVMAKVCVIRLTRETVHFIVSGSEGGPEGVQVWSQVKVSTLFSSYRIESRSDNEIYLEVTLDALLLALKSADHATTSNGFGPNAAGLSESEIVMKLTKKDNRAALTFEITGLGHSMKQSLIKHDVGITVLSPTRVTELKEPLCPTPDIHITLPQLQQLKGLTARMARLGSTVTISANKQGAMSFRVHTDDVTLETKWSKLQIPKFNNPPDPDVEVPEHPPDHYFSVTVGLKSFLKFLSTNLEKATTIACICEDYCLIAYVYIGEVNEAGGVMTFFIPALTVE